MLLALQWLLDNNKYYRNIHINTDALAMLPVDEDLTDLLTVSVNSTNEDAGTPPAQDEDIYPYSTHLSVSFVPSARQQRTEQETVR